LLFEEGMEGESFYPDEFDMIQHTLNLEDFVPRNQDGPERKLVNF